MINLSRAKINNTILDPFCGSGTILTESLLMGYKDIIGSDISEKAINDTRKNIEWVKKNYGLGIKNYALYNKDVLELSKFIKPNSIDAIITEPYLGPQRGKIDIRKARKELEKLYSKSLVEFTKVLKLDGRVVMVWPIFHTTYNTQHITPNLNDFKIINPIPKNLKQNKVINLTKRNTIIYGRTDQKIWREIVVIKRLK
jgi:tRNA G10  N-methylase Trm11